MTTTKKPFDIRKEPATLTIAFKNGHGGARLHAAGKTNNCRKCGAYYRDSIAAGYCCVIVDSKIQPKGECYWCGNELHIPKQRQLFCNRACGESFRDEELHGQTTLGLQD